MINLMDNKQQIKIINEGRFFYRALDAERESQLYGQVMKISPEGKIMGWDAGGLMYRTLEACLDNWENVNDSDGKPIEFKKELIKFLPKNVRDILYESITQTKLSEAESKNS